MKLLQSQYQLIISSREVVLNFCGAFPMHELSFAHDSFAGGSIRNLLVHVADTYSFWLGNFALKQPVYLHNPEEMENIGRIKDLYEKTNALVADFLEHFGDDLNQPVENIPGKRKTSITVTPLQLFTHVTTHEFHHKGQIMSMSRQLGHIPVDTDVIRF